MAVAFDAVGPSAAGAGNATSASLSWTHTAVGSNVALLVGVSLDATADGALTMAATCAGVTMTSLGKVHANAGTQGYLQVWGLTGVASGNNAIVVTVTGGTPGDLEGGSLSFTGAAGFGTPVTGTGSSTTPSVAVATNAIGSVLAGFIACGDAVASATSPATSRFIINQEGPAGFATGNSAGETAPGTGASVTMAWAISLAPWAIIAVEVKALIAPPPPPAIQFAPGWFPGAQAVTVDPGGIPFYAEPAPADATPAVIFPPTPEADPIVPVPPGWFPGASQVTAAPGAVPFTPLPGTTDAAPAVIYPVPEMAGEVQWLPWPPNYFPGSQAVSVDPGGIPFYSQPQPLTPPPAPAPLSFPYLHGTAGTGTGTYFTDQNGQPYMLRWDTVWNLIVNAGNSAGVTTWQSDMDGYCAARAAEGFNGFLTTPVATTAIPSAPFTNGNTWDGVAPFTSPGALNGTFWSRVDYLIASAQNNGLTVVLNVGYTYSVFNTGGPLNGWTAGQFQAYGAAVGARYSSAPNLVWEVGDDYGGSWDGGLNGFDTQFAAFLTGLRSSGAAQMISVENMSEGSSRYSIDGATTYAWGVAHASFDWIYSYDAAYVAVENAYTEAAAHSVASLAVVKMDGWYDNQYNGGTLTESVELFGRKWIWWTLSSGSRGVMYGQNELYQWQANALSSGLAGPTPGSQYMQPSALNLAWNTLASFTGWHLLVPDTSSALVTAGRGSRSNGAFGTGAGTAGPTSMYLGGNTYVTASKTADGTLAVIYIPNAASAVTVNGSVMVVGYTATWVDPASGAQTPTAISSTYAHAAANSAGDHDWLLVLQAPPAAPAPSGILAGAPLPPGWFPGADAVTTQPGGIPFSVPALGDASGAPGAVTFPGAATLAGTGSLAAPDVTQGAVATLAAAGSLSNAATEAPGAILGGAGSAGDTAVQGSGATLAGTGSLTAPDVAQGVTATMGAAGSLTGGVTQGVTAALAGTGSLAAPDVTQLAPATLSGTGSLNAPGVTQGAGATLSAAGSLTTTAVQAEDSTATVLTGTGSLTTTAIGAAVAATLAAPAPGPGWFPGSDGLTQIPGGIPFYQVPQTPPAPLAPVTLPGAATLTGTGSLTAAATQGAGAPLSGAGSLTNAAAQGAGGTLAGTGSLNAPGVAELAGTVLAGAGSLAALALQRAAATLAGTGSLVSTGTAVTPFTVGQLTASVAPSSTVTATATRTGGPS